MAKRTLEAFSDGVIVSVITIVVLEMKVPNGDRVDDLRPLPSVFLSYVLSFVYVGIYWNNHHHILHACTAVTGRDALGQSALIVLALIVFVRHRVDGGEPFRGRAHSALRRCAADGRDRVLSASAGDHPRASARFGTMPEKSASDESSSKQDHLSV
jgi:hypothetical protein